MVFFVDSVFMLIWLDVELTAAASCDASIAGDFFWDSVNRFKSRYMTWSLYLSNSVRILTVESLTSGASK